MPRIAAAVGAFALIVFSIGFNIVRYPVVWEMVGAPPNLCQSDQSAQPAAAWQSAVAVESTPGESPAADWADDYSYSYQDSSAGDDWADDYSHQGSSAGDGWADDYSRQDSSAGYDRAGEYSYQDPPAAGGTADEYSYQDPYSYSYQPSAGWDDEPTGNPAGVAQAAEVNEQDDYQQPWGTVYNKSGPAADASDPYGYSAGQRAEAAPWTKCPSGAAAADTQGGWGSARPLVPLTRSGVEQDPAAWGGFHPEVRRLPPIDRVNPVTADRYTPRLPASPIPASPVYPTTGI